jgi:hypothetical protein
MPTNLLNTGIDDLGNLLPLKAADPHWKLIVAPPGVPRRQAEVLSNQRPGLYWNTGDSQWVGADPKGTAKPGDLYKYQTDFVVNADSDHWLQINGVWCVDNIGQITIDGAPVPAGSANGEISLLAPMLYSNFMAPHAFSISNLQPFSVSHLKLSPGVHYMEVSVWNLGLAGDNPSAFNVSAKVILNTFESWRGQLDGLSRFWQQA